MSCVPQRWAHCVRKKRCAPGSRRTACPIPGGLFRPRRRTTPFEAACEEKENPTTITEKVAYLKGLSEGLGIDTEKSKEGKLISVIVDILEEVGHSLEDVDKSFDAVDEAINDIYDQLDDLTDAEEDDEDECCCDEDECVELECPNCGEPLCIDDEVLDQGTITCPNCEQKFAIDFGDEEEGCGCGCGHDHDHEAE